MSESKLVTKTRNSSEKYIFYLLEFENGVLFGRTNNLKKRLKSYQAAWHRPIISMYHIQIGNVAAIEDSLRAEFWNHMQSQNYNFLTSANYKKVLNFLAGSLYKELSATSGSDL